MPLPAFIAERTARVKAARAAGDRALATRIAALPKPSGAAWLVNLFAREDAEGLQRLLDLGAALRDAQAHADRARLRALGGERRDRLTEAVRATGDRARSVGGSASDATLDDFQQTLQAALVSDEAAAAVRTGRLVRALHADGLDPVDLTDAVAGGDAARPQRTAAPRSTGATRKPGGHDATARQEAEREAAEAARRAAEQQVEDADRRARASADEAGRATEQARAAETLVTQRSEQAEALRAQLDELRQRSAQADQQLTAAREASATAHASAADAVRSADDARVDAETAADRLRRLGDGRR